MKKPYTYSHRSRKAMTAYLLDRQGYADNYKRFPFSWNVKISSVNWEHPRVVQHHGLFWHDAYIDTSLDAKWAEYLNDHPEVSDNAIEDAQRDYAGGNYTTYPGDDHGDWLFGFYGRSGGHLCLEVWCGTKMYGGDFDLEDYLAELGKDELRTLYRAVRCMDADFTRANATANVEYHVGFIRGLWEEEQHAEMEAAAREMEASRPDMYGED